MSLQMFTYVTCEFWWNRVPAYCHGHKQSWYSVSSELTSYLLKDWRHSLTIL